MAVGVMLPTAVLSVLADVPFRPSGFVILIVDMTIKIYTSTHLGCLMTEELKN